MKSRLVHNNNNNNKYNNKQKKKWSNEKEKSSPVWTTTRKEKKKKISCTIVPEWTSAPGKSYPRQRCQPVPPWSQYWCSFFTMIHIGCNKWWKWIYLLNQCASINNGEQEVWRIFCQIVPYLEKILVVLHPSQANPTLLSTRIASLTFQPFLSSSFFPQLAVDFFFRTA